MRDKILIFLGPFERLFSKFLLDFPQIVVNFFQTLVDFLVEISENRDPLREKLLIFVTLGPFQRLNHEFVPL